MGRCVCLSLYTRVGFISPAVQQYIPFRPRWEGGAEWRRVHLSVFPYWPSGLSYFSTQPWLARFGKIGMPSWRPFAPMDREILADHFSFVRSAGPTCRFESNRRHKQARDYCGENDLGPRAPSDPRPFLKAEARLLQEGLLVLRFTRCED